MAGGPGEANGGRLLRGSGGIFRPCQQRELAALAPAGSPSSRGTFERSPGRRSHSRSFSEAGGSPEPEMRERSHRQRRTQSEMGGGRSPRRSGTGGASTVLESSASYTPPEVLS